MFLSFPLWVTSALTNSTEKSSARSPFSPGVFSFFSLLFSLSFFFCHSFFYSSLLSRPTYFGRIEVARPSYSRQMNQSREVTRRRMVEIEPWNFPTLPRARHFHNHKSRPHWSIQNSPNSGPETWDYSTPSVTWLDRGPGPGSAGSSLFRQSRAISFVSRELIRKSLRLL